MFKFNLLTSAVLACLLTTGSANAYQYPGQKPSDTEYSVNSITGVYRCTPRHVAAKECSAVDEEYYRRLAITQFGPYRISILTTVDDKQYMVFEGGISEGAAEKLEETLDDNPDIDVLLLSSNGGLPVESVAMGKVIRDHKLTTWIPFNKKCMSACALAFVAGIEYKISGVLGFHNVSYNYDPMVMTGDIDKVVDFVNNQLSTDINIFYKYFNSVGISSELIFDFTKNQSNFLYVTTVNELNEYKQTCADCVDEEKFLMSLDDAKEKSKLTEPDTWIDIVNQEVLVDIY